MSFRSWVATILVTPTTAGELLSLDVAGEGEAKRRQSSSGINLKARPRDCKSAVQAAAENHSIEPIETLGLDEEDQ